MPLKIVKAHDPIIVRNIVTTLYAVPGTRKTSLFWTAHKPLLINFDRQGLARSRYRKDAVDVESWQDVTNITEEDLAPYQTIGLDTVGRALDSLSLDIKRTDPKAFSSGTMTQKGWGMLKSRFISWVTQIQSFGKDVVFIAHCDEQKSGDDMIERIDVQGGSKNEIYKSSDAMGRLVIREGKLWLLFSPTETAFGKNPAGFDPTEVPTWGPDSTFLGDIIEQIKTKLNEQSEEQRIVSQALTEWQTKVNVATSCKALTDLIAEVANVDERARENAKRLLNSFAKDHGFTFDKAKGAFIEAPAKVSA